MRPRPLLLTGFEPFGGDTVNPSWEIARALDGERIGGARVVAVRLPCIFGAANEALRAALDRHRPQLVLALGLAASRAEISVERVAINVDDARIPDNAGAQPVDEPIVPGGAPAHFSSLPIKAIVAALQQAGLPAVVSQTAGTFVCNHVFYGLMQQLRRRRGVRGGFIHVPALPQQALPGGPPGLALTVQVSGIRLALHTALHSAEDLRRADAAREK